MNNLLLILLSVSSVVTFNLVQAIFFWKNSSGLEIVRVTVLGGVRFCKHLSCFNRLQRHGDSPWLLSLLTVRRFPDLVKGWSSDKTYLVEDTIMYGLNQLLTEWRNTREWAESVQVPPASTLVFSLDDPDIAVPEFADVMLAALRTDLLLGLTESHLVQLTPEVLREEAHALLSWLRLQVPRSSVLSLSEVFDHSKVRTGFRY